MTSVWRIGFCPSPVPPPSQLLSLQGLGATLGDGRWHTKGPRQLVYCGSSRALCQLEKRVHANGEMPRDQALLRLELPDGLVLQDIQTPGALPAHWRENMAATQAIGNAWLARTAAVGLWVPSFVEPAENNLLLNPAHPDFARIVLIVERQPFRFDPRLF